MYISRKSRDNRELTIGVKKSIWKLNECALTTASLTRWDIHLLWHDMISRHVFESYEMRQEQVESMWDETNVSFSLSCCLDESVNLHKIYSRTEWEGTHSSFNNEVRHLSSLTRYDLFASKNYEMRQMYHSHSHSHLVLYCLNREFWEWFLECGERR